MGGDVPGMMGWVSLPYWVECYGFLTLLFKCCTDEYSQEEYTVKKINMVGADYLQVTIYTW